MMVDKEKLFPVNQSGILINTQYQSYEQRLKVASSNRPSIYPVIHDGEICGIISRKQLVQLIGKHYLPADKLEKQVA